MEDCKYALKIIESVSKGEVNNISDIIESFQIDTTLRQYVNLKKYNMNTKVSYCKDYIEIKGRLSLFKNTLEKYVNSNSKFFYHDEAIIALICSNIKPNLLGDSYIWLEQQRHFFEGAKHSSISDSVNKIELILNNNALYQKYMNLKSLKNIKYYYPSISCNDRYSSTFYYNNAVAIYNWDVLEIDSTLRSTLASVGKILYISSIIQGDSENINSLKKLQEEIYFITSNSNILTMPDDILFSDMFSLHIMSSSKFLMTKEMLGVIYNFVNINEKLILSKVNSFFNNLKLNENKLKCKSVLTGKEKEV